MNTRVRLWPAASLALDVVSIAGFVVAGRSSHHEALTVGGIAATSWPFFAGLMSGWVACRAWAGRYGDLSATRPGVVIWAFTLFIGMSLRAATGGGVAVSFVIVTAIFLALTLVLRRKLLDARTPGRQ